MTHDNEIKFHVNLNLCKNTISHLITRNTSCHDLLITSLIFSVGEMIKIESYNPQKI